LGVGSWLRWEDSVGGDWDTVFGRVGKEPLALRVSASVGRGNGDYLFHGANPGIGDGEQVAVGGLVNPRVDGEFGRAGDLTVVKPQIVTRDKSALGPLDIDKVGKCNWGRCGKVAIVKQGVTGQTDTKAGVVIFGDERGVAAVEACLGVTEEIPELSGVGNLMSYKFATGGRDTYVKLIEGEIASEYGRYVRSAIGLYVNSAISKFSVKDLDMATFACNSDACPKYVSNVKFTD